MKLSRIARKVRRAMSSRDILVFLLGALIMFIGIKAAIFMTTPKALHPETDNITITWLPESVKRWHDPVRDMAKKYDIDPNLLAIIITLESGGDPQPVIYSRDAYNMWRERHAKHSPTYDRWL